MEVAEDRETTISNSDTAATTIRTTLTASTAITSPTPDSPTASTLPQTRSSSRVKAAREKASAREQPAEGSSTAKTRPDQGRSLRKRKKSEPGIVINEPTPDPKGKKRAVPEPDSSEEQAPVQSPPKRTRKQSKPTRSKPDSKMPKKGRTSKGKTASSSKAAASTSEDVEMLDASYASDGEHCEISDTENNKDQAVEEPQGEDDESSDAGNGEGDNIEEEGNAPRGDEEAQNIYGLLGGDFAQLGAFLSNISSRLKSLLANIKQRNDPTARVIALQELSELLSVSNEDTLHSFSVDSFVTELVKIMGGTGRIIDDDDSDPDSDDGEPKDPDAVLAAALAAGEEGMGEDIPEAQLLACRCLANLMEAIPGSAHTVVYHGAIPVLCSKLINIMDIDLAEQTLSTMEKISEEYPSAIVRENGLSALLSMLDFFPTSVQRIALQAAANCCRNFSADNFNLVSPVFPILRNMLGSFDQRLVEYSSLCVIRLIESFQRSAPDNLVALLDAEFIQAIGALLLPASGSPLVSNGTYTLFLSALASASKASAKTTLALLEADLLRILYQLLTGVLPPSADTRRSDIPGSDPVLTEMAVMENMAHRSKEQIEEALALVNELMPPLPRDGVFDSKAYTEKGFTKMAKAKAKAEKGGVTTRAQASAAGPSAMQGVESSNAAAVNAVTEMVDATNAGASPAAGPSATTTPVKVDPLVARLELLQSNSRCVNHFLSCMLPVLVDVYSASVLSTVRVRALSGILKAASFADGATLQQSFKLVPIASFAASILITGDQHPLTIGALQLVELLLMKCSSSYRPEFQREGVLHAIDSLASRKLIHSRSKSETSTTETAAGEAAPPKRSIPADPQDVVTIRARVIRLKYLSGQMESEDDHVASRLRSLAETLALRTSEADVLKSSVGEASQLLSGSMRDISSFEIRQSGMVETLLVFVSISDYEVPLQQRQQMFVEAFTAQGLATLVKRLQEMLTRTENFEVRTVSPGHEDSKHRSASLLARAMRLKLVADESSDIPKAVANMTVSIQAIATFQALNDYLRPRLSGAFPSLGASAARLSAMLAMAESRASAMMGASSSSNPFPTPTQGASTSVQAPADDKAEGSSKGKAASIVTRRRSQRLSAKKSTELAAEEAEQEVQHAEEGQAMADTISVAAEDDLPDSELEGLVDREISAEVVDGEDDERLPEKTVNLAVTADGTNIEAKTPHGTRVATPNPTKERASAQAAAASSSRSSYAAALKSKPSDWHLEFSIDDYDIPLDATIYGAIYQHELRKSTGQPIHPSSIWSGMYTVKFKKVEGPPPPRETKLPTEIMVTENVALSSLPENNLSSQILRLLRVLAELNSEASDDGQPRFGKATLQESAFVNNKLTAKLVRQLEETMIVASSCLPDWALDLPQHYPLIFPFSTRFSFLQSTSFGYARLILKWQSQQQRSSDSRRDDSFGYLGRLQRQKVRISRKYLLESAIKVFELYGSSSSVLEVEYFEEVGTGLGPTLEFYSLVSKELARRDLKIWHEGDTTSKGTYVSHPHGLFPAPLPASANLEAEENVKKIQLFQMLGQFVAKALLDSRIVDVAFNRIFLRLVLGKDVPATITTLRSIDPTLGRSLSQVQQCKLSDDPTAALDALSLDFIVPGYDIELRPNGRNIAVTAENVDAYISETLQVMLQTGVLAQVQAFRTGFSKVFSINDMSMFSVDELGMLFGNADEDWSPETLSEAMKADHGFTMDSQPVRDLISIMNEYDKPARRRFLQFITGSPRLPIGGFRGLNPALTVVRKPNEPPLTPDDYLPSVMTCVNYLKLPRYSTKDVMKQKIRVAVDEGIHSGFHLS